MYRPESVLSQSNINRVYVDQNLCCLSQTLTEFVQTTVCSVSVKHRQGLYEPEFVLFQSNINRPESVLSQSNINGVKHIDQNLFCLCQTQAEGGALRIAFMNKMLRFTNTLLLLLLKASLSAIPHHTTAPAHHSNSMSQTSQSLNSYLIRRMIKAQIKAIRVRIANCSR